MECAYASHLPCPVRRTPQPSKIHNWFQKTVIYNRVQNVVSENKPQTQLRPRSKTFELYSHSDKLSKYLIKAATAGQEARCSDHHGQGQHHVYLSHAAGVSVT